MRIMENAETVRKMWATYCGLVVRIRAVEQLVYGAGLGWYYLQLE